MTTVTIVPADHVRVGDHILDQQGQIREVLATSNMYENTIRLTLPGWEEGIQSVIYFEPDHDFKIIQSY